MDRLEDILTTRLGPFVLWQWLAIAAAGVVVSSLLQRTWGGGSSSSSRVHASDLAAPPTGVVGTIDNAASSPGQSAPATNLAWVTTAVSRLAGLGYSAVGVDGALRRYLEGQPLNTTQLGYIDAALMVLGAPPEGAPSIQPEVAPDPVTPPTPPPATVTPPPAAAPSAPPPSPVFVAIGSGSGTSEADRQAALKGGTPVVTAVGNQLVELVLVAGESAKKPAPGQTQLQERQAEQAALLAKPSSPGRDAALAKVNRQIAALRG